MVNVAAITTQLHSGSLAGSWALDSADSHVALKTKAMFGIVPVKGSFGLVEGTATVGETGRVTASISVGAASINTKMKKRDEHLRSADFFDVERHPRITVTIDSVDQRGEALQATGTVTVKDTTAPVTFPVSVATLADGKVELDATVNVDRSELGLGFRKMGATKMENTLIVHAVFHRA